MKNKILQQETSELQTRFDAANRQVNTVLVKKDQEPEDRKQRDIPSNDDLVCMLLLYNTYIAYLIFLTAQYSLRVTIVTLIIFFIIQVGPGLLC